MAGEEEDYEKKRVSRGVADTMMKEKRGDAVVAWGLLDKSGWNRELQQ